MIGGDNQIHSPSEGGLLAFRASGTGRSGFIQAALAYSGYELIGRSSASTWRPIRATMSGTASTSV